MSLINPLRRKILVFRLSKTIPTVIALLIMQECVFFQVCCCWEACLITWHDALRWVRSDIWPLGYWSNSKGAQTYFIRCWRFSLFFFLFICAHVHELHTSHKRYTMCKRCILLKFFILGEKAIENPSSSNDTIKGFLRKRLSLKSTF